MAPTLRSTERFLSGGISGLTVDCLDVENVQVEAGVLEASTITDRQPIITTTTVLY